MVKLKSIENQVKVANKGVRSQELGSRFHKKGLQLNLLGLLGLLKGGLVLVKPCICMLLSPRMV